MNGYEKLTGCLYNDHRNKDDDSFYARQGSKRFVLRLFYVDAPKSYISVSHNVQRKGGAEQSDYVGHTVTETLNIGLGTKAFTERKTLHCLHQVGAGL